MVVVVGFLQNAWSGFYAGSTWPRASWLRALANSRSGQRLAVLEAACTGGVTFVWDNTTPLVGETPASVVPPDPAHIRRVLAAHSPLLVLTLGEQARKAVMPLWDGPLLAAPHPACRVLTNMLYEDVGRSVARCAVEPTSLAEARWFFRQLKGSHCREPLEVIAPSATSSTRTKRVNA